MCIQTYANLSSIVKLRKKFETHCLNPRSLISLRTKISKAARQCIPKCFEILKVLSRAAKWLPAYLSSQNFLPTNKGDELKFYSWVNCCTIRSQATGIRSFEIFCSNIKLSKFIHNFCSGYSYQEQICKSSRTRFSSLAI